jgi:hypothetical protein
MIEVYDLDPKSAKFEIFSHIYITVISNFNLEINLITRFSDINYKALKVWKEKKKTDVFA